MLLLLELGGGEGGGGGSQSAQLVNAYPNYIFQVTLNKFINQINFPSSVSKWAPVRPNWGPYGMLLRLPFKEMILGVCFCAYLIS